MKIPSNSYGQQSKVLWREAAEEEPRALALWEQRCAIDYDLCREWMAVSEHGHLSPYI